MVSSIQGFLYTISRKHELRLHWVIFGDRVETVNKSFSYLEKRGYFRIHPRLQKEAGGCELCIKQSNFVELFIQYAVPELLRTLDGLRFIQIEMGYDSDLFGRLSRVYEGSVAQVSTVPAEVSVTSQMEHLSLKKEFVSSPEKTIY